MADLRTLMTVEYGAASAERIMLNPETMRELSDKEDAKGDDKAELKERKVKIKVAKKASNILGIQVMHCRNW